MSANAMGWKHFWIILPLTYILSLHCLNATKIFREHPTHYKKIYIGIHVKNSSHLSSVRFHCQFAICHHAITAAIKTEKKN